MSLVVSAVVMQRNAIVIALTFAILSNRHLVAGDKLSPPPESFPAPKTRVFRRLRITLEMIKIEHTIFALPFAFMGAFLAARGLPSADKAGWILLAMVGARSAAMAFNRLVD